MCVAHRRSKVSSGPQRSRLLKITLPILTTQDKASFPTELHTSKNFRNHAQYIELERSGRQGHLTRRKKHGLKKSTLCANTRIMEDHCIITILSLLFFAMGLRVLTSPHPRPTSEAYDI